MHQNVVEPPPIPPDFRAAYAEHRAAEGRAYSLRELLALPYLKSGRLAKQWAVRARTSEVFFRLVRQFAATLHRPVDLLDLGAGNGWLSYRAALAGFRPVALDIRDDEVDGLGAARGYLDEAGGPFQRVAAWFESLPFPAESFDVAVFNASLHYALSLNLVLAEAARVVRGGGRIVILDSPFYGRESAGMAMVTEKRGQATHQFGQRADTLLGPAFIEFLTPERLTSASVALGLSWQRHRVRYPLWYEMRPLVARLRRGRAPSRFDLWQCTIP